jgi:hypothetical protein
LQAKREDLQAVGHSVWEFSGRMVRYRSRGENIL